jgi:hypothetical protein
MSPNHVTNVLLVPHHVGEAIVRQSTDCCGNSGMTVDFEMLIPMPKEVYDSMGTSSVDLHAWSVQHWGTKWNAYHSKVTEEGDRLRIQFDTAWSHPGPAVKALSEKFPMATLDVEYADDNVGYNLGSYKIKGGIMSDMYKPKEGSIEAETMSWRIRNNVLA